MNLKQTQLFYLFLLAFVCLGNIQAQRKIERSNPESFTMIMLPDPQSYNKFDVNQGIFDIMLSWIANNKESLNIKAVLCTGDLVEQNESPIPGGNSGENGNQTSNQQWKFVSHAFERLDNKIPYMLAPGNHDFGYQSAEVRFSHLGDYFQPDRNSCWGNTLVSMCNNAQGHPTLENAAYEVVTEKWGKFLIICAEFAPRDEVLTWAKGLCDSEKYKNHKVFFLTHSYMDCDGSVIESEGYKMKPANYGKAIWERLVYPSANLRMVLCGHAATIGNFKENVSYRVDKNEAGIEVPQMMFNAQTIGGGWHGSGGDGWMRIFEFMPDGKTIQVKTFSPYFAVSPTTQSMAWRTEPYDQFEIIME